MEQTHFQLFLSEITQRFIFIFFSFCSCFLVSFLNSDSILFVLVSPFFDQICSNFDGLEPNNFGKNGQSATLFTMNFLGVSDLFFCQLTLSFIVSLLINLPFFWLHFFNFCNNALSKSERRIFLFLLSCSCLLLFFSIFFCLQVVLPRVFIFFLGFISEITSLDFNFLPTLKPYVDIVFVLLFAMIVAFQLPVFLCLGFFWGLFNSYNLVLYRRWVIFFSATFSALVSPPEFFSQMVVFLPILIFYELFVFISILFIFFETWNKK